MSSCYRLSQASFTRSRNLASSGERVSSRLIMSHTYSIGKRSGVLADQDSCTPWRARCIAAAVCGRALSCWKIALPSCRINGTVSNMCRGSGYCLLYPAETPNVTSVLTDAPHTKKPEVKPVYRGRMHSRRWRSPGLRRTRVCPSLAYRQNLISSLKTTECYTTLQSPVDSFTTQE